MPTILSQHAMHSLLKFILKGDNKRASALLSYSDSVLHDHAGKNLVAYLAIEYQAQATATHSDYETLSTYPALAPYFNPNLYDGRGWNSLHIAICSDNIILSNYLIQTKQFDVNQSSHDKGRTALHLLCILGKNESAAYLVNNHRAKLNVADSDDNLPIHYALKQDNIDYEFIKFLIEQGSSIYSENIAGDTPLSLAIATGNNDVVELILQNFNIECHYVTLPETERAMSLAAKYGNADLIRRLDVYLLNYEISEITLALGHIMTIAINHHHAKVVQALIELYPDTNIRIMALKIAVENHKLGMLAILKKDATPKEIKIARSHLTALKEAGIIIYRDPHEFKQKNNEVKEALSNKAEPMLKLSTSKKVTFLAGLVAHIPTPPTPPATPPAALLTKGDETQLLTAPTNACH